MRSQPFEGWLLVNVSLATQTMGNPTIKDVVELNKIVKVLKESYMTSSGLRPKLQPHSGECRGVLHGWQQFRKHDQAAKPMRLRDWSDHCWFCLWPWHAGDDPGSLQWQHQTCLSQHFHFSCRDEWLSRGNWSFRLREDDAAGSESSRCLHGWLGSVLPEVPADRADWREILGSHPEQGCRPTSWQACESTQPGERIPWEWQLRRWWLRPLPLVRYFADACWRFDESWLWAWTAPTCAEHWGVAPETHQWSTRSQTKDPRRKETQKN